MEIIVVENYEEMSQMAAGLVARQIEEKPNAVLGLATGSTPIGMYNALVAMYTEKEVDFSQVKSFNLDEYVGLAGGHPQSYQVYMQANLFSDINIAPEHTYLPNGVADDLQQECERYEAEIKRSGGIDLQILGIGENGHIGFNEPGSSPTGTTAVVQLAESTIQANARFFDSKADVPQQAITVGIGTIVSNSKHIILLANGANKAQAIKNMIEDEPNIDNPASFLQQHSKVTVIVDQAAAQLISK